MSIGVLPGCLLVLAHPITCCGKWATKLQEKLILNRSSKAQWETLRQSTQRAGQGFKFVLAEGKKQTVHGRSKAGLTSVD